MIYRKHIQREYLAAQRRELFPETTLPEHIDRAIPIIGLVVCFVVPVALICIGWL